MMDCRFQVVDAKKVALQNFLAPTNKKVTLTNDPNNADDNDNDNARGYDNNISSDVG